MPRAARPLGFWTCLALVVGNMIGAGIYLLPATLAPMGINGTIGWCVTIGGALCLAFVFARLGAAYPRAGGPYAFAQAAFGPAVGFAVAWSYWVLIWAGNAAVAIAVVGALSVLVPPLATHPGAAALTALAIVWTLIAVNIRGATFAAGVQVVTTILKLVPLAGVVLLAGWLLWRNGDAALATNPPVPLAPASIAAAAAITFWGFLGVESATVPADKIVDAARVIPRVTLIGTALAGIVYLLVSTAITAMMPAAGIAASPAPIALFLGRAFGPGIERVVALFAAISALGVLNGFILLQGEMPRAMAEGGVFPRWFAHQGRWGTPARAHLVSGILVTLVTLANYTRGLTDLFTFIASMSLAAGMLAYFVSAIAAIKLLPGLRGLAVAAIVSAAFVLYMLYGLGARADLWGLMLLVAGLPVYLQVRRGGVSATVA